MSQFGQHPSPGHRLVHLSDTHFLGENAPLHGSIDTEHPLAVALARIEESGVRPDAVVFTGDLTDLGEVEAYRRLRAIVEPVVERLGAQLVWVMGNHDERAEYATELFDEVVAPGEQLSPRDRVYDLRGLRLIALDSTVPGYHHGELTPEQLEWLAGVLRERAEYGTILALHHPPIPTTLQLMALLELRDQDRLAEVIDGTDVRAILGGHLHYSTHSTLGSVPVSVVAATCYTMDLSAEPHALVGRAGGRSYDLVDVYADRLVHSTVPLDRAPQTSGFDAVFLARFEAMSPAERLELFSRKPQR